MDYDTAVGLIKRTEAYDTEQKSINVDLMDLEGDIPLKDYSGKEVSSIMDFVEKVEARQLSGASQTASTAAPQSQVEVKTKVQAKMPTATTAKKVSIINGMEAAAAELEDAISHIESKMAKATEKTDTSGLILPGLSINDQLSELEKINLGLEGNIFNEQQLGIIKMEVRGLASATRKHRKPQESERQLVELRDKRLKEVLSKIGTR